MRNVVLPRLSAILASCIFIFIYYFESGLSTPLKSGKVLILPLVVAPSTLVKRRALPSLRLYSMPPRMHVKIPFRSPLSFRLVSIFG